MAILGFIIVVAGRVFSDSTIMRVRSQNMLKSSEELGKLANLISEDVSQMGVKVYMKGDMVELVDDAYMDKNNQDSSSYKLSRSENGDTLVFRKIAYEYQGENVTYLGVREITWYLEGRNVHRSCKTIKTLAGGTTNDECPEEEPLDILMSSSVDSLRFYPSASGIEHGASSSLDTLFNFKNFNLEYKKSEGPVKGLTVSPSGGGPEVALSDFADNGTSSEKKHNLLCLAEQNKSCHQFNFKKGETYAIEFNMPFRNYKEDSLGAQFLPGMDHFAIGLRNDNYDKPPGFPSDVLVFPTQASEGDKRARHIEISTETDINDASIVLVFAFYSPLAANAGGRLVFSDFKVFRKSDRAFHFPKEEYGTENISDSQERLKQKKNAKAFEMILEVSNKGERVKNYTEDENGRINGMVILTPNNGISAF
jgi:hypothetical protein